MNFKNIRYHLLKKITWGKKRKHYQNKCHGVSLNTSYDISGNNNKLFLIEENKEVDISQRLPNLNLKINGNNNLIRINKTELENKGLNINLCIEGSNNQCLFSEKDRGNWNITCYGDHNFFKVGENTACGEFNIALHSNYFEIGRDCMISSSIELWTDGHSVLDAKTKECLNVPTSPILVGNHVWLGRRVTLTKGAQIPDDCIVGIASVVTKKFTEPNCVIAGNPAKVVKQGITWDGRRPNIYQKEFNKLS